MGKKFNVGDKVKVVVSNNSDGADKGAVGVIFALRSHGAFDYEVKFDHATEYTHHGDGHREELYRWYNDNNLELVEPATYTTKYKPGDEVTVRSDLTNKAYYMVDGKGYMTPTYQMLTKRGKKVKIKSVTKTGKYMIEGSIFPWTDEMFVDEAETKPTGKKYKVGDHVKIRNYGKIQTGVIKCTQDSGSWYGVEIDDVDYVGHNFGGFTLDSGSTITSGRGTWCTDCHIIELVDPAEETEESNPKNDNWKVVITPDGDKTTLEYFKDGKVEKTVTVNRFSEDEYSANAAIKATVDKLMLSEKFAVTVKFDTGKGEYTYLTDDTSIKVDDIVVVPTGKFDNHTLARVTSVTPFLVAKITVPFRDLKYVIEKSHPSFKVGDKIIAQKDAPYGITTNGWKGVVTRVDGMPNIRVQELNGFRDYGVSARYFDLLEESPKETEPKYYNGKVVCVDNGNRHYWKVGKIYEIKDGVITDDDGDKRTKIKTLDELPIVTCDKIKFIPVVE